MPNDNIVYTDGTQLISPEPYIYPYNVTITHTELTRLAELQLEVDEAKAQIRQLNERVSLLERMIKIQFDEHTQKMKEDLGIVL